MSKYSTNCYSRRKTALQNQGKVEKMFYRYLQNMEYFSTFVF